MRIYPKPDISQERLIACVRKWQKRLGLEAWEIHAEIRRQAEVEEEMYNSFAYIHCNAATLQAAMVLIDPQDMISDPFPYNLDRVVCHELLHCHFARSTQHFNADESATAHADLENAVELTARAICAAYDRPGMYGG